MIRELQPGIVINDRLPGGDYDTPEQFVPAVAPERPWEVCLTMNDSWGYNPSDTDYKSARELAHTLCEIAGKGGRLLLNLSPKGDGSLPPEQVKRLREVGAWLQGNGAAIQRSQPGLEPWQFYGPSTRVGNVVYLHALMRPYDTITVRGVPIRRVTAVRHLATGQSFQFTSRCAILDQLLNSDPLGELTIEVPEDIIDPLATVLAIEIRPSQA
jgi:alpha-L-fucosidase